MCVYWIVLDIYINIYLKNVKSLGQVCKFYPLRLTNVCMDQSDEPTEISPEAAIAWQITSRQLWLLAFLVFTKHVL